MNLTLWIHHRINKWVKNSRAFDKNRRQVSNQRRKIVLDVETKLSSDNNCNIGQPSEAKRTDEYHNRFGHSKLPSHKTANHITLSTIASRTNSTATRR